CYERTYLIFVSLFYFPPKVHKMFNFIKFKNIDELLLAGRSSPVRLLLHTVSSSSFSQSSSRPETAPHVKKKKKTERNKKANETSARFLLSACSNIARSIVHQDRRSEVREDLGGGKFVVAGEGGLISLRQGKSLEEGQRKKEPGAPAT
ncbi:unnamed protein product, partial [Heterotrigona itama]